MKGSEIMDAQTECSGESSSQNCVSSTALTEIKTVFDNSVTSARNQLDPDRLDAILREGGSVKGHMLTSLASLHSQLDHLLNQLESNPTEPVPSQLTCAESRNVYTAEHSSDSQFF